MSIDAPAGLDPDAAFFWRFAPWSYDPKVESSADGRIRSARELARAEHLAYVLGWAMSWIPDDDPADRRVPEYIGKLYDIHTGDVLASDGSISISESFPEGDIQSRVVAAELALEVLDRLGDQGLRPHTHLEN